MAWYDSRAKRAGVFRIGRGKEARKSQTNVAENRKWQAVMGPCKVGIKTAVVPIASLLVQIMLLSSSVVAGKTQECVFERCSHEYQNRIELNGLFRGANARYCSVLRLYMDCLRSTARGCRGNLKFHTTSTLVIQWTSEYNCTYLRQPVEEEPLIQSVVPTPSPKCVYRGRQSSVTCALFGDPHLRTFDQENQTCKVLGAWPLIDNEYLAVQVTNEAVVEGFTASATSEITVIIKQHHPCTQEKTYEAVKGKLPPTFIDGTHFSGIDKGVQIHEKIPGLHIEIDIKYISTLIVIRHVGHYLTFAISAPKDVALQDDVANTDGLQLCVKGCPSTERINHRNVLILPESSSRNRGMSRDDAVKRCRINNFTSFYFESCVFDLMTTGDDSFLQAANQAMIDYLALNPGSSEMNKDGGDRRVVVPMPSRPRDGVGVSSNCGSLVGVESEWIVMMLVVFVTSFCKR